MVDLEARMQKAIDDLTGNESLLEMLETEAATEMLKWGESMVASVVKQTADLDDQAAEAALDTRLKAVRRILRSVGNWAAGKYTDPEDRLKLRDDLLGHLKTIRGGDRGLPSSEEMGAVLDQVDGKENTQLDLILKLEKLLNEPR